MFEGVLQEILKIIYGMVEHLPEAKISIAIGIGLVILTIFKGRVGIFLTFILLTILAASSFFAAGDIYQISLERAIAGIILGFFALVIDLYLFVRTIADWRD